MSKFYITTAIAYASRKPHAGNAYDPVLADFIARYRRLRGDDVYYLTGTDEHGIKIQQQAEAEGVSPQELADRISAEVRKVWDCLNVGYDCFIRTTELRHKSAVQKIFKRLYDQDDIYKSHYEGWYCTPDESFYTESQAVKKDDGSAVCPECGRPLTRASEEAYFLRLSKYETTLKAHIFSHPEFLMPESRRNEMIKNFLEPGLNDLCVSRTSFKWGIPVEFDPGHVVYVWIDALSNYITALGYLSDDDSLFKKNWPADVQILGKDVVRFHTIYWPVMLMALGLPLPKTVFGHGFYSMNPGEKMSKTTGNTVYADELVAELGVDAVRYYLLREMPYASDGVITREQVIAKYNTDLANDLGNLLSRTCAMASQYFGGAIEASHKSEPIDGAMAAMARDVADDFADNMRIYFAGGALSEVNKLVSRANKYIDETRPWILAKDPEQKPRLSAVLYTLCELLRISGILLMPAMPDSMTKLLDQLGVPENARTWNAACYFGFLPSYKVTKGDALFPRVV